MTCRCWACTLCHYIFCLFVLYVCISNVVNAVSLKVLDIFSSILQNWCIRGQEWTLLSLGSKGHGWKPQSKQHFEGGSTQYSTSCVEFRVSCFTVFSVKWLTFLSASAVTKARQRLNHSMHLAVYCRWQSVSFHVCSSVEQSSISRHRCSISECNGVASVIHLSVRPSVCRLFAQIASSARKMDGSRPNLHTIVSRWASIQGVLNVKVKGHVIWALLCCHGNRFFSLAGSRPNLLTMVPRRVYIQGVLKFKIEVKGHVIPAHLEFHKKIANSVFPLLLPFVHSVFFRIPIPKWLWVCAVSDAIAHMVKQFIRMIAIQYGLTVWRSVSTCAHFMKHHCTYSFQTKCH